jgi:hypothetical protein
LPEESKQAVLRALDYARDHPATIEEAREQVRLSKLTREISSERRR